MATVDVIIKDATIVTENAVFEGTILIDSGKIAGIVKSTLASADTVINASGKLVLPGAIDVHAHIHDINYTYREDFYSGSVAAAAGGMTGFINMPLVTHTVRENELKNILKIGEENSIIDFSQHAGNMEEGDIPHIEEAIKVGVGAFKTFTCPPYHMSPIPMMKMMREIKKYNGIQLVHSEDYEIVTYLAKKFQEEGRKSIFDYFESRPDIGEAEAIRRVTKWAEITGVKLHVVHVSSKLGSEEIRNAKNRRVDVTAETCIQYLFLNKEDGHKWGAYLKMNPTLKTKEDNAALWKALADGTIDMVTTDHAPGTKEEKEIGNADIWKAWGGIPGVEDLFPLLLYETIKNHKLTLERLVQVTSANPAKRFNWYPTKGFIGVGSDADLVIVDPKRVENINVERSHYKCGWNVYEGKPIIPIEVTLSRGEIIAENGEVIGKKGRGKFIPTARAFS
ncbi:MAG: dihydroorotase [Candidatus Asgardarchaeia archaeon]